MVKGFGDGLRKDQYILQVEKLELPFNGGQYHANDSLKRLGGFLFVSPKGILVNR